MKFCLGVCPFCYNQGLIHPIKDKKQISFFCDEACHKFERFEDVATNKLAYNIDFRYDYMSLDDFLKEMPHMKKYVFVFENGGWYNLLDHTQKLF